MELQHALRLQLMLSPTRDSCLRHRISCSGSAPTWRKKPSGKCESPFMVEPFGLFSCKRLQKLPLQVCSSRSLCPLRTIISRRTSLHVSQSQEELAHDDESKNREKGSGGSNEDDDYFDMDEDERKEWRMKIREVIDKYPDVDEEVDPVERAKKMQKLLADYPLVVEEDDPDWPEDADGRGFNLDQFFNKITIKNVKKEDDDENYDSENEIVWKDDDYTRPIKDITSAEWEEAVFRDISPLIVLVHNRYRRPKQNEMMRDELEKAVNIIWNCRLPSPRCVAIDAVVELDLVSALQVSVFPELIFTKSGKILYREKAIRTADELSKIMAFFYYGAAKPPCLSNLENRDEAIPVI